MFVGTTKALAARLGLEYIEAAGLVKGLEKLGRASDTGQVERQPGAKGRGATIWKLADPCTLTFGTDTVATPAVEAPAQPVEAPAVGTVPARVAETPAVAA